MFFSLHVKVRITRYFIGLGIWKDNSPTTFFSSLFIITSFTLKDTCCDTINSLLFTCVCLSYVTLERRLLGKEIATDVALEVANFPAVHPLGRCPT